MIKFGNIRIQLYKLLQTEKTIKLYIDIHLHTSIPTTTNFCFHSILCSSTLCFCCSGTPSSITFHEYSIFWFTPFCFSFFFFCCCCQQTLTIRGKGTTEVAVAIEAVLELIVAVVLGLVATGKLAALVVVEESLLLLLLRPCFFCVYGVSLLVFLVLLLLSLECFAGICDASMLLIFRNKVFASRLVCRYC